MIIRLYFWYIVYGFLDWIKQKRINRHFKKYYKQVIKMIESEEPNEINTNLLKELERSGLL